MTKLNKRAFEILRDEVERCATNDAIGKTEKLIVIKRFEKLRQEKGAAVTLDELRDAVSDVYPQFSEKVLRRAVKLNRPPGVVTKATFVLMFLATCVGVVWLLNLPNPMLRRAVAKTAPLLLTPSYMEMDSNYRGAIDSLGQAEQLLDNPTSAADIEQGGEKVKQAKKHLDNLPRWSLDYYPEVYCNYFGCAWRFSYDEFETARKKVARLQAVAFQNKNALTPLEEAEQELLTAKSDYKRATNIKDKEKAIEAWQSAINLFEQIPAKTLAAENAQAKLKAYKRELEDAQTATLIAAAQQFDIEAEKIKPKQPQTASQLWQKAINRLNEIPKENPRYLEAQQLLASVEVKYRTVDNSGSNNYIEAAKQYAIEAAKASQNPPHPADKWEQIAQQWRSAIEQLKNIDVKEAGYVEAQKLIAQYQTNLGIIQNRQRYESEAKEALQLANQKIQNLIASAPSDTQQFKAEIQGVINVLRTVKPGTTSYAEAQQLLTMAQNKLR
ncbi:hypothetical protein NIES4071_99950 [Calothrix sp. NIES-4071]|nr:hypothetical protein NIES4071_99950 [Calothrix sp. NIES-4071]BAZ64257.1 hypothetical protein NIES4105_99880 [Calothrix sp. NIES-4105]